MKLLLLVLLLSAIVNVISFTIVRSNTIRKYSNILMSNDNNNVPKKTNEYYQNKIINMITIPLTLTSLALSANAADDKTAKKTKKPKVKETDLGIKYIELKKGDGLFPNKGNNIPSLSLLSLFLLFYIKGDYIVIDYTGFLPDGKPFDTTIGKGRKFKPLAFRFGEKQVIPGLESVLENMQPGIHVIITLLLK